MDVDMLLDSELNGEETLLTINAMTRTISISGELLLGVESDEGVKRIYFECPRVVGDNIDLSQYHIYINYQNANGEPNQYWCDDVTNNGETIRFSWLLKRHVTEYKGTVKFIVCAKKSKEDGEVTNEWNTTVAFGKSLEGLEVTKEIEEQSIDVIEQILTKLDNIEVGEVSDERIAEAVEDYLIENPIEEGSTDLTDEVKFAILDCFKNVAWAVDNGNDYYNALYNLLINISFTQSDTTLTMNGVCNVNSIEQNGTELVLS